MPAAVVLLSGGLDSATAAAVAQRAGFDLCALSVDYGQRHRSELSAATSIARSLGAAEHRVISIDLGTIGGSALTDASASLPTDRALDEIAVGIPSTYVPARNTVFLALALAYAEVAKASDIFIGVNAVDYSGYPDCRPEFISAFGELAKVATRAAVEGDPVAIHAPLVHLTKVEIIRLGSDLGVDLGLTVSCYDADVNGRGCGRCDSCRIRARAFVESGVADPTRYRPEAGP